VELSEFRSEITFFSVSNIENSVTTHGRTGKGSSSRP
jgi:hypothetical protein